MKNFKRNIFKLNEKFINFFDYIFNYKNFKNLKGIAKLNKILVPATILYFLVILYFSIPVIYDKSQLQKELPKRIQSEFKLDLSFSPEISYSILPAPNFIIKNVKIFNNLDKSSDEISQIKKLRVFISKKNFFNKNNIKINKIVIEEANFSTQKKDFDFINNFLDEKFSHKKIIIKKSNIFYRNKKNKTIVFFPIKKINIFYDDKKKINSVNMMGKMFNTPFNLDWSKSFDNLQDNTLTFKLNKLNLEIKNQYEKTDKSNIGQSTINIKNEKLNFEYEATKNEIIFNSVDSRITNNQIELLGKINTKPFNLELNGLIDKIKLSKLFEISLIFQDLMNEKIIFSKNLSANITLDINKLVNNKLFDNLKLFVNFNNGVIDFDDTTFVSQKIGNMVLVDSSFQSIDNESIFFGRLNFQIEDKNKFHRTFQIPKKHRNELKNIYFDIEYNVFKNKLKIFSFKINDPKDKMTEKVENILAEINYDDKGGIDNWIDLKNTVIRLVSNYFG